MKKPLIPRIAVAILASPLVTAAGTFTYSPLTGDADSGIKSGLTYTALANFNGTGRTVNGVNFSQTTASGANYTLTGAGASFSGFANNVTGNSSGLVSDFFYTGDGSGNASLTLTGLTIGQKYVTSWYAAGFGGAGGRLVDITPSDTGTAFRFDENYTGAGNGNVLRYAFTANATSITYNFDAVSDGDSFHHYAFTNSVANSALLSTPVITAVSGPGPFTPFTVSNNDLLQTRLASTNSSGSFALEGAGGIPILNNGSFTINGGNPADNSQLATGGDGAFVEFNLDLAASPLGYDISSIQSFGGWNDSGRDRQLFKLSYSLVGDSSFVFLGSLDFDPTGLPANTPSAIRGVFDTALTGVDAIRVDFYGGQENTYAGYGEFDVIGTSTVPEPTTFAAMLAGVGAMGLRRRRRQDR